MARPYSIAQDNSVIIEKYRFDENNNDVFYVCADIWNVSAWSLLVGRKINVVFSDALHSLEALASRTYNVAEISTCLRTNL